jgi:SAM-dependent methyltransferase
MTDYHLSTHAGQAIYTRRTLAVYDIAVLGVSNVLIWRCPTRRILDLYHRHVTDRHLDVGVGTGWFLDHCRFPAPRPHVALLDLNPTCLSQAAARIARYQPEVYQADVLQPIQLDTEPFSSISLSYLLHCLPGTIQEKAVVFDHLKPLLAPGGVLFGATLLSGGVVRSAAARALMAAYNAKGIFANRNDDLDGLRRALESRFDRVDIEVAGCGALFVASSVTALTNSARSPSSSVASLMRTVT